jgi:branched-chain amino acid transport system permease protein
MSGTAPMFVAMGTRPVASHSKKSYIAAFAVIAALLAIAPFVAYPVFVMKVLCFALFALAFNLLFGFGGMLSFGHAAYFGMASYVSAYTAKYWGLTPELSILSGVLVAAILGMIIGGLAIRSKGIYFSMVTLAFAQMIYFFSLQAPSFTGGEDGIQTVPRRALFGLIDISSDRSIYLLVCAIFLLGLFIIYRTIHSPFGQVLKCIRENENRALSLGYNVPRYKHLVFVLSASLAGMAGATKALVFQLASLTDVHWAMSGEVVLMAILGGIGTIFGPILGATVIVGMQNYLASMGAWVMVIQGCVFVVCVLVFREGILGLVARLAKIKL